MSGSESGAHPGNTPLDPDESDGLLPSHVSTRAELNQWEAANIARAIQWASRRSLDVLEARTLAELHRRMFDDTWSWAGRFRQSDKNLSPFRWTDVPRLVSDLVADTRVQRATGGETPQELDALAVRFHHRLVLVHPWPNGNGRHARLATDLLLRQWKRPVFTWGGAGPDADLDARVAYLQALRAADSGDFSALETFVRS